jgi:ATP-binding cassette subfamily B protein
MNERRHRRCGHYGCCIVTKFNVDDVLRPVTRRPLRRLPLLTARSIMLMWSAARRPFLLSASLQALAGLAIAAQVLVGRHLLHLVLSNDPSFAAIAPALTVFVIVTALVAFAGVGRTEQQRLLSEFVASHATDKVLEVATSAPLIAYETPGFHDRLERAKTNAVIRPMHVANGVIGLCSAGFAVAGIGAALFVMQPVFLTLVAMGYVPSWLASVVAGKAMHDYATAQTERDRRRMYLLMTLTGKQEAQEVRAFNLGGFLRAQHDRLYNERIDGLRTVVRRRVRLGLIGALLTSLVTAATLAALLWFVTSGRMTVAAAGASAGAIVLLGHRLQALASAAASLYEGSLFLEDFTSFVDSHTAIEAARPTAGAPTRFSTLSVRDVSFAYPSRRQPVLRGVSLEIHAGEVVALVGENGSGKTTLAKLLAGLLQPDAGTIAWDGTDTAAWEPYSLRQSVAVIFQDFIRYHLTAAENIALGRHERHDDGSAIAAAARRAGIHQQLLALDDGYGTRLGPQFFGGSDLSVGQWQRVALARAFFRDAPFVILDEPTASLDPRAEAALFADIRSLCQARSVLLISHRFSSVRTADRIYVLRDGQVIERGTHDELIAFDGYYADLFRLQASSYLDLQPTGVRPRV